MTATAHLVFNHDTCRMKLLIFIITLPLLLLASHDVEARKIRQSLKVTTMKEAKGKSGTKKDNDTVKGNDNYPSIEISLNDSDSIQFTLDGKDLLFHKRDLQFAGYDKGISSSRESFFLINRCPFNINGIAIRINYYDMQSRMLHSRDVTISCDIPAGETRKLDIPTWDTQHTFYYYLGNAPRRVASPYKVTILPLRLSITSHP